MSELSRQVLPYHPSRGVDVRGRSALTGLIAHIVQSFISGDFG